MNSLKKRKQVQLGKSLDILYDGNKRLLIIPCYWLLKGRVTTQKKRREHFLDRTKAVSYIYSWTVFCNVRAKLSSHLPVFLMYIFLYFSCTSSYTLSVSKNKMLDFWSGPVCRLRAVFHSGMVSSVDFMPSVEACRRNVQNWSEACFVSEKKIFPQQTESTLIAGKFCIVSFSLCHVNVCCKCYHLFSPVISPAPLQMMQLSKSFLEKSVSWRTLLVNNRHCNKLRRPFWCYFIPADLLATYCLFKFKAIRNRDLAFLCWL